MTEAATRRHTLGTPCWASLMVRNLAESRRFYHEVFGWEFRSGPEQLAPYLRAVVDGQEVAGMGEMAPGRHFHIAWMPYMWTDDADATSDLIRDCGGTVAVGPLEAGRAGRLAVAADTAGASFGVWQAGARAGLGTGEAGAVGTPVWFELLTRETSVVAKFYPAVFDYEAEEDTSSGTDYLTLRLDGRAVAGVRGMGRELPQDRGPHWNTYFAVEDTDAVCRRVTSLGGRVVHPPHESPYGRLATVTDPEGAQFCLIRRDTGQS